MKPKIIEIFLSYDPADGKYRTRTLLEYVDQSGARLQPYVFYTWDYYRGQALTLVMIEMLRDAQLCRLLTEDERKAVNVQLAVEGRRNNSTGWIKLWGLWMNSVLVFTGYAGDLGNAGDPLAEIVGPSPGSVQTLTTAPDSDILDLIPF